eukprot:2301845-Rhodomonas_salina.3
MSDEDHEKLISGETRRLVVQKIASMRFQGRLVPEDCERKDNVLVEEIAHLPAPYAISVPHTGVAPYAISVPHTAQQWRSTIR